MIKQASDKKEKMTFSVCVRERKSMLKYRK